MAWRYRLRGLPGDDHRHVLFHLPMDRKAGAGMGQKSGGETAATGLAQHRQRLNEVQFDVAETSGNPRKPLASHERPDFCPFRAVGTISGSRACLVSVLSS